MSDLNHVPGVYGGFYRSQDDYRDHHKRARTAIESDTTIPLFFAQAFLVLESSIQPALPHFAHESPYICFTYDDQLKTLFTTAEGLVSFAEVQTHLDKETAAKALGYREIIDATATSTDVISKEAKQLVRRFETLMRSASLGPTVTLTPNDGSLGTARMLVIFC